MDAPAPPLARITVIQLSLRVFASGLLSLVPLIGIAPAAYALYSWGRIYRHYRNDWNPASDYLGWGTTLALLGVGITAVGIPALILTVGLYHAEGGS